MTLTAFTACLVVALTWKASAQPPSSVGGGEIFDVDTALALELEEYERDVYQTVFEYLPSVEDVAWDMAEKALAKHEHVFFSLPHTSTPVAGTIQRSSTTAKSTARAGATSNDDSVSQKSRPAHSNADFLPLDHLVNHLLNTRQHIAGILHTWQFGLKGYLEQAWAPQLPTAGTASTRGLLRQRLSCYYFPNKTNPNRIIGMAPLPTPSMINGFQVPFSAQKRFSEEIITDVSAFVAMHRLERGSPSNEKGAGLHDVLSSAAFREEVAEILVFLFQSDDYAVGRGRVLQESILLDLIGESLRDPFATNAVDDAFRFLPHTRALETRSATETHHVIKREPLPLVGINRETLASDQRLVESVIGDPAAHLKASLNTYAVQRTPLTTTPPRGRTREEGRLLLEEVVFGSWASYIFQNDPNSTDLRDGGDKVCAPFAVTNPRGYVNGEGATGRAGRDHTIEIITGPENRHRQLPVRLSLDMTIPPAAELWRSHVSKKDQPPFVRKTITEAKDAYAHPSLKEKFPTLAQLLTDVRLDRATLLHGSAGHNTPEGGAAPSPTVPAPSLPDDVVVGDRDLYRPYLDPTAPGYKRILCATYTYHKNIDRAIATHRLAGHLCDKHLLFTDKPYPEASMARLDQNRFVVMALNTPQGENYFNMWQKTRMILEKIEMIVRGWEGRTREEGCNDPEKPHCGKRDETIDSRPLDTGAFAARDTTPGDPAHPSYDYVLLSGDDVCLNVPKMRAYLAEMDELYGVHVPTSSGGGGRSYLSVTTPQHIGFSHRSFISGATYILNTQGYLNFLQTSHHICHAKEKTFAEDVLMGACHGSSGVIHRNGNHFGDGEDVFNSVGIEYITGMTHTVHSTWWLKEYKRRVVPRGGVITSRDDFTHHFCPVNEMVTFAEHAFAQKDFIDPK